LQMSTSDSFFEMAKTVQDTYSSGTMQGELYTLEKIKDYLNSVRETDEVRIIKSYVWLVNKDHDWSSDLTKGNCK